MKFAVIGEGVIDRFILQGGATDVIGGSGLNTAIAGKRAGLDIVWATLSSRSANGRKIAQAAIEGGVLSDEIVLDYATPLVEIRTNSAGVPDYTLELEGAVDWQWTPESLQKFIDVDVLHLTSLSALMAPGADVIFEFLKSRPPRMLLTYDPNARPSVFATHDEATYARNRIEDLVLLADIVKVSDEDLSWISTSPISETAERWSLEGPKFVVVTLGEKGITVYCEGKRTISIDGFKVEVVDTVGAGDTLMAWLLRTIDTSNGIPSEEELLQGLQLAAKAAAITCSRQGANPPTALEVLQS
ncbi:MAG: hypothetical protein RIS09_1107 [Actinomycetota bacterium]|jgi:fructokinase